MQEALAACDCRPDDPTVTVMTVGGHIVAVRALGGEAAYVVAVRQEVAVVETAARATAAPVALGVTLALAAAWLTALFRPKRRELLRRGRRLCEIAANMPGVTCRSQVNPDDAPPVALSA